MPFDVANIGVGKPVLGRHISDLYTVLTGTMADQPVTLSNTLTVVGRVTVGDPSSGAFLNSTETSALNVSGQMASKVRVYSAGVPGSTNWSALVIDSANASITTQKAGTGAVRDLIVGTEGASRLFLQTNSTLAWQVSATGHLLPGYNASDTNTYDIGATSQRPRTVYAATGFVGPGAVPTGGATAQVLTKNTGTDYDYAWLAPVGGALSWPLLAPAGGTVSAPSYSFAGATNLGIYQRSNVAMTFAAQGQAVLDLQTVLMTLGPTPYFGWAPGDPTQNLADVRLYRDAAGTLAQRNGTNAQGFVVYGTYTDASNYQRVALTNTGLYSQAAGTGGTGSHLVICATGVNADIYLRTNSTDRWWIHRTGGSLLASTDNTTDIGLSGIYRPRTVYVGTSVITPTVLVDDAVGAIRSVRFRSAGLDRWVIGAWNDAEAGANVGSPLDIRRYTDAGALIGLVARVYRDTGTVTIYTPLDAALLSPSSNVIEQRNGTNPQTLRIYGTTDAGTANYERLTITVGAPVSILHEVAGTGAARQMTIGGGSNVNMYSGGTTNWIFHISKHFLAATDNVYDIGAAGNKPRSIYAGTSVVTPQIQADVHAWGSGTPDIFLIREAANVLAQRNGTNPQGLWIYNTYTDASNYERIEIGWAGNLTYLSNTKSGTGAVHSMIISSTNEIQLQAQGVAVWRVNGAGLWASTDNTYDIGASGATRPRTIYAATSFIGPGAVPVGGTAGQVLQKNTGTNYDVSWITPSGGGGLTLPLSQHLTFATDNTYDVGTSSVRVRTGYFINATFVGTVTISGSGVSSTGNLSIAAGSAKDIYFTSGGVTRWQINNTTGHLVTGSDNVYDVGASGATRPRSIYVGTSVVTPAVDTPILLSSGTNIIEQRNGLNPQTWRLYNSYTDASNYSSFEMAIGSGQIIMRNRSSGTGSAMPLIIDGGANTFFLTASAAVRLQIFGATRWGVETATVGGQQGHLVPGGHNIYDIGWSNQTVRDLFVGRYYKGDFSNATLTSRTMFQTSTTDGNTQLGVIPNGTSTTAALNLFSSSSDPANASLAQVLMQGAVAMTLSSNRTGTGTYLPMVFATGGATRMSIDTAGAVFVPGDLIVGVVGGTAVGATTGFLQLPACGGTPTGVPANALGGLVPCVFDYTNNRLCLRYGGVWHYIAITA